MLLMECSLYGRTARAFKPCSRKSCTTPRSRRVVRVRHAYDAHVQCTSCHTAGVPCQIIPDPPCQIIPHPLAQSASAPGSCKIFYDSLFSTLRLAALIEWETEIRQAGEAVLFYLENDENKALRFSHGFAVDFETLK